ACDVNPNTDIAENPSQWRANTAQSALEAENQVVKFAKRRDFLSGRVTEVENIIRILDGESPCVPDDPEGHICETAGDEPKNCSSEEPIAQMVPCAGAEPCPSETMCPSGCDAGVTESYPMYRAGAIDKFVDFLCGPAADLIRARIDPPEDLSQEGLPFHAIYGWRDEPKDVTADPYSGKWHIVKVEARIPGMCDSACGVTQAVDSDPTWPRVETETSSWGLRRCYYLTNTDGVVKFRVTRFDQDKTSNPILFPNGIPIWRFKSNNPLRMLDPFVHNPSDLTALCDRDKVMLPGEGPADVVAKYKGAFMLNSYDVVADANAEECWDLAHALLSVGAVNETCAQYYWHGSERGDDWDDEEVTGANPGMGLRFVPCQPF
ncbi:MAG TPA: hypothetical protein PKV41_02840, partial [Candidatus Omnitrophota bacterium]|nr:hypothetical protein [Candidatus Omnitrophota bacterium]